MRSVPEEIDNRVFGIDDKQEFRDKFDKASFLLTHSLSNNPLFEFKRLFELVKTKKASGELYWDMGDIGINQRWSEIPPPSLSVEEAFERIETANAWLILRSVHTDPSYGAILESAMKEVERLSGVDFNRYVKLKDSIVFINSPLRISTYHIDRECSILMQICGDKTVHVYDRDDRDVLTEVEIEKFWTVDHNAPRFKEQFEDRDTTYRLNPGQAVHIPVNAPHWVKNGDSVSISLNVNFHYRDFVRADLYRANYLLRLLGLTPTPPGKSKVLDTVKRLAVGKPISLVKALKTRSPLGF